MILTDSETKVDLLNNEAIAATIIELLRERPNHPVTIGVHGDWGAGKSSILEMIEAGFDGKDDVLCLKFNGWRLAGDTFEDGPRTGANPCPILSSHRGVWAGDSAQRQRPHALGRSSPRDQRALPVI